MQSQYCPHNIVGERIFPSRIAEFGLKFPVRLTRAIVTAKRISTLEIESKTGAKG